MFRQEENIKIIGSLESIVCVHNILKIIDDIKKIYKDSFVIAIDAAVSKKCEIGQIVVSKNSMLVGSGIGRKNIYVGDMSIKGIVNKDLRNPKYNFRLLQNTSLRIDNDNGGFSIKWNI